MQQYLHILATSLAGVTAALAICQAQGGNTSHLVAAQAALQAELAAANVIATANALSNYRPE